MKKIVSLFICLLMLLSCTESLASGINYTVSPANVTIAIPESMEVFTRDTAPDDERFALMGFGYDTMMESFNSQNIYLQAMSTEFGNQKELVLICTRTDEKEYSDVATLYNAAMAEGKSLEKQGKSVISEDIFEYGGTDFVMVEYSGVFTSREYITVHSGMKIRIRLTDYEDGISADEEDFLETIVKSVKIPQTKEEKQKPQVEEKVNSEPETKEEVSPSSAQQSETSGKTERKIPKIVILILGVILLITIIPLIMRMILFSRGLSRGGAKAFAIIYSILASVLIWYLKDGKIFDEIPVYFVAIPLLWSFVIYKIVKH